MSDDYNWTASSAVLMKRYNDEVERAHANLEHAREKAFRDALAIVRELLGWPT